MRDRPGASRRPDPSDSPSWIPNSLGQEALCPGRGPGGGPCSGNRERGAPVAEDLEGGWKSEGALPWHVWALLRTVCPLLALAPWRSPRVLSSQLPLPYLFSFLFIICVVQDSQ